MRQRKPLILKSVQVRIALWTSICLMVSGAVIVAHSVIIARSSSIQTANERALSEARTQANLVRAEVDMSLIATRTISQEFMAIKDPENPLVIKREQGNAMMKQVLIENSQYLGIWTLWEPDEFDGQDTLHTNTQEYGTSGRYQPYYHRGEGEILVEAPTTDSGDWYQVPKKTKEEYITDLYTYQVAGKDTLMVSVVVPIVVSDIFYGVMGIDIGVGFLQEVADKVDVFGKAGKLFLIGNNGRVIAATGNPEFREKALNDLMDEDTNSAFQNTIDTGKENSVFTEDYLKAIVPIRFGEVTNRWAAVILVPNEDIVEPANALMWQLIGLSLFMLLLGVGALWGVARQIAWPIEHISAVARKVADGDFEQKVRIGKRQDELGQLSGDFNHMTEQLQNLYDELENRVIELKRAEDEIRKHRDHLEEEVKERTAELEVAKNLAEKSNKAKSVFLANMSHELRTPLNAVLGFSNLMKNAPDTTTTQKNNLEIITRSGEHLLNLINNVLDISKIESGRMSLEQGPLDLYHLVKEMKSMMHVKAYEKGLDFNLEQATNLPHHIVADAKKLRQVLLNLIGNAIKYTVRGTITLRAMLVESKDSEPIRVRFEVEDTGPGIREEDRKRIFKPFEQLEDRAVSETGTGLGLAISKQHVALMGGSIGVAGIPCKGSLFYFEIPVSESPLEIVPSTQHTDKIIGMEEGQPRYRLLIVEDQPENRLLLRNLLEPYSFDLREAVNGEEAVTQFNEWLPHLIWMDMRLPVMDGQEATRRIKSTEAGKSVKIIAITAHALEEERSEILAAGCDDFIRKPYHDVEIFNALSKHLNIRFIYEADQSPVQEVAALNETPLTNLPAELLKELEQALILLDIDAISHLIEQAKTHQPAQAKVLENLAKDFEFDEMLQMIRRC